MNAEQVQIETGTVHTFNFGPNDVELVHILVEKPTEVQLNSLYSAESVDNFIKSDKNKLLPKMIVKYESNILRLTKLQRPVNRNHHLQLIRLKKELAALKEKLFRWAVEAIEEDFTVSASTQHCSSFDRAEFLVYKSTERVHGNKLRKKDDEINKLTFNLKVLTNAVKEMKQNDLSKRRLDEVSRMENTVNKNEFLEQNKLFLCAK
jgi:hypothetical protein